MNGSNDYQLERLFALRNRVQLRVKECSSIVVEIGAKTWKLCKNLQEALGRTNAEQVAVSAAACHDHRLKKKYRRHCACGRGRSDIDVRCLITKLIYRFILH